MSQAGEGYHQSQPDTSCYCGGNNALTAMQQLLLLLLQGEPCTQEQRRPLDAGYCQHWGIIASSAVGATAAAGAAAAPDIHAHAHTVQKDVRRPSAAAANLHKPALTNHPNHRTSGPIPAQLLAAAATTTARLLLLLLLQVLLYPCHNLPFVSCQFEPVMLQVYLEGRDGQASEALLSTRGTQLCPVVLCVFCRNCFLWRGKMGGRLTRWGGR